MISTVKLSGPLKIDSMTVNCREIEVKHERFDDFAGFQSLTLTAIAKMHIATHKAIYKRLINRIESKVRTGVKGCRIAGNAVCTRVSYDRDNRETHVEFKSSGKFTFSPQNP